VCDCQMEQIKGVVDMAFHCANDLHGIRLLDTTQFAVTVMLVTVRR
jgi:hypothetical protein